MSTYKPPTYTETWHEGGYKCPPFAKIAAQARSWGECIVLMDKALRRRPNGVIGPVYLELIWWQRLAWEMTRGRGGGAD